MNKEKNHALMMQEREELALFHGRDRLEEVRENMKPLDVISGFQVRPGFYELNGATAMPNGVNFTLVSRSATACELLLFHRQGREPYARIAIPESYRAGSVWSIFVFGLKADKFEYAYALEGPYDPHRGLLFDRSRYLLDPYARAVTGQSKWGMQLSDDSFYKARVVHDDFVWNVPRQKMAPLQDCVIYELHVRGFTQHESAGVTHRGTFAGIMEKIPYLQDLGINTVELMPVFEFDETRGMREVNGETLLDYWGYNPVSFFAPNTSYSAEVEYNREGTELKRLIRSLHDHGIRVIFDVVFNHTAEGDERGPFFSFKGIDNNVYYMLTPDGKYYNFSGCGNTLNCNHPMVRDLILNCLRYWTVAYHVDGFRFDLASILGRDEQGAPMNNPPLLESLAYDPILSASDLIAEAWDAGGLYQVGSFPNWNRWSEWNGRYRDDLRSFLKGDAGFARAAAMRIIGSPDLYPPDERASASINFITCHDGFTMYDLYAYNTKHNEGNGWNNTDGSDDNRSWNCGAEGESDDPQVCALRRQMIRNAITVLMCSRGTPMFLAGDEFCNTQFGNNNAYCQDNLISWLNWDMRRKHADMYAYFRFLIHYRHAHPILRKDTAPCSADLPFISLHGTLPWNSDYDAQTRVIGVMYAGRKEDEDDIIYLGINAYWEKVEVRLPTLMEPLRWSVVCDTARAEPRIGQKEILYEERYVFQPRSVCIFTAKHDICA